MHPAASGRLKSAFARLLRAPSKACPQLRRRVPGLGECAAVIVARAGTPACRFLPCLERRLCCCSLCTRGQAPAGTCDQASAAREAADESTGWTLALACWSVSAAPASTG